MIESDASNGGWGACCNVLRTRGQWSRQEAALHINGKELLATFLAVQTFAKNKRVRHIRLKVDNKTAVYYINYMGGTRSQSLMKITSNTALELVPAERHCALSRTFSGSVECGSRSEQGADQSRHQPSSLLHGGKILKLHTPVAGRDGNSGVHSMDLNLFVHL